MSAVPLPQQLAELAELLGRMCFTAAGALQNATAAMLERRERLVSLVAADARATDALRQQVEELATDALLFHQPVAGDLRTVVSAIRSAGDIDRMSRLALHVAEAARRHPERTVPDEVAAQFAEMGRVAVALGVKAAEVARTRNVVLAVELEHDDDAMDVLHSEMFTVLMNESWPHGVPAAVDASLLARYYERFADHAVAVAAETVYAVTGREPPRSPSERTCEVAQPKRPDT